MKKGPEAFGELKDAFQRLRSSTTLRAFTTPSLNLSGVPRQARGVAQALVTAAALGVVASAVACGFTASLALAISLAMIAWILEAIFDLRIELSPSEAYGR